MNNVPLLFAETIARLLDDKSLQKLTDLSTGHFGNAGRSLWEKRLCIFLNVVNNSTAKTFEYCLNCSRSSGNSYYGPEEPYTYDPADHRFVRLFGVRYSDRNSLNNLEVDITWTSADPTLLKLLRAPFARPRLFSHTKCPEFLKLLPNYCTFNHIYAPNGYNEVLGAIIQRSQEFGRLENVDCKEFFTKRGREASIDWIATSKRLQYVSNSYIRDHEDRESIGAALANMGVQ